jgi:hypothetical protein
LLFDWLVRGLCFYWLLLGGLAVVVVVIRLDASFAFVVEWEGG